MGISSIVDLKQKKRDNFYKLRSGLLEQFRTTLSYLEISCVVLYNLYLLQGAIKQFQHRELVLITDLIYFKKLVLAKAWPVKAFRILYSQGIPFDALGVPRIDGGAVKTEPLEIWRLLPRIIFCFVAQHRAFGRIKRLKQSLALPSAFPLERLTQFITRLLTFFKDAYRPHVLFEKFRIEAIPTTERAINALRWHQMIRDSSWTGRVITSYRPDAVVDPEFVGFADNVKNGLYGWGGRNDMGCYLASNCNRRAFFKIFGATLSNHGHPTTRTENLAQNVAKALFYHLSN